MPNVLKSIVLKRRWGRGTNGWKILCGSAAGLQQVKHVAGQFTLHNQGGALDPSRGQLIETDRPVGVALDSFGCQSAQEDPSLFSNGAIGVKGNANKVNALFAVLLVVFGMFPSFGSLGHQLVAVGAQVLVTQGVGHGNVQDDGLAKITNKTTKQNQEKRKKIKQTKNEN